MATKIVKTLKFPNNTDEFQINAARLGGKTIEDIQSELDVKVSLVGTGTAIPSGADLNTVDYLKVGYYICDKSTIANSLVNCPVNKAFMMQVYSPFSSTINNETSSSGVYRIRKIEGYDANEYVQFCSSPSGTTGWTYGEWEKIINTSDVATTSKDGLMSLEDKVKLDGIATGANKTTVDTTVSATSSNPIANKTIKSYVDTKVANIVNSAPETLDTLNELAAALGDDPNFATTVATQIGNKADKTEVAELSNTVAQKAQVQIITWGADD